MLTSAFSHMLAVATCFAAQQADTPGLIAHYTFDEAAGSVLKDCSRNGNDGVIRQATWVKSPRGHALSFNGIDSLVEIRRNPSFDLTGDATVEAWLRTTSDDGRDRLLFGDGASLAVNRSLLVNIDRGVLSIEHANGRENEAICPNVRFDGQWRHVAFVCEYPHHYTYVDGKLVNTGTMTIPLTQTQGGNWFIGGWWAGHFKGEIDEIRLYRRALSEREVLSHYHGKVVSPPLTASISHRLGFSQGIIYLEVTCRNLSDPQARAELAIVKPNTGQAFWTHQSELQTTRPGSERAGLRTQLAMNCLSPGQYETRLLVKDTLGHTLGTTISPLAIPAKPSWLGSTRGLTDTVLPPYSSLTVDSDPATKDYCAVGCWGRRYEFGRTPLLRGIRSGDVTLLAAPMRVGMRTDTSNIEWQGTDPLPTEKAAAKATIQQSSNSGPLATTLTTTIEYDGLATVCWRLKPTQSLVLQTLTLEIPLKQELARYLYTWPTSWGAAGYSGSFKGDCSSAFKPIVWLGDEQRGLSWFCESDQYWSNADPGKAIEVVRQNGAVVLRLNLIDKPIELKANAELTYTFAFQATPVKPIAQDGWKLRFTRAPWYGYDYDLLTKKIQGKPALQWLQDKGSRTFIATNWTPVMTYPWPVRREREFKALVQACHKHGIKLIPYLGYQISELAAEYNDFKDDAVRSPLLTNPDKYPGMEPQMVSTVCLRGPWRDCLVDQVARMVDEYDIDGVYLDSTNMPFGCTNTLHGCGYARPDGTIAPTYPVFAVRETFRRLYAVIKAKKPDGIVDSHVFDCMNSASLAFSTSYWNGEQLTRSENLAEGLPLDRFRTEMMGVNWGVPADFLHYTLGDFEKAHAISLLHDILIRPYLTEEVDLSAKIWKLADDFGRTEARFLPYWNNGEYVTVTPSHCHASLYHHPKNGVLAIVSNLGKAEAQAAISFNLERLGLAHTPLSVTDALNGKPIRWEGKVVSVPLASLGWQYVWLRSQPAR